MRDNELELIAALAEGSLEDETLARALIESSEEHRAEYEAQKLAIHALRGAGAALMDDTERAVLRRDLWTALRAGESAETGASPWYYRWAPVAAGLLVVVGLVAVINRGGEDEATQENFEAAGETTITTGAAANGAFGGEGEPEPTAAGEQLSPSDRDLAAPYDLAYLIETAQRVRDGDFASAGLESFFDESSRTEMKGCVDDAELDSYMVLGTIDDPALAGGDTDTLPEAAAPLIAAIPEDAELATAPVAFVALSSCELVYFDD